MFKIFFQYFIFLENINIGHLKMSRYYFWPPKFSEKKNEQYIFYIFVYTFVNVLIVEIVVLLTKI